MLKKNLPLVSAHMEQSDKDTLTKLAAKKGMTLATYIRVLLLTVIEEQKNDRSDK